MALKRTILFATSLVWALSVSSIVGAEESCPVDVEPERAREVAAAEFDLGQSSYDAGRYQEALEHFICSYQLVQHSATLFNISEAAQAADDPEMALRALRGYLARYPDAEGRAVVEERIRVLERQQEQSQRPSASQPDSQDELPTEETSADNDQNDETDGATADEEPSEEVDRARMSGARRAAWALMALGLAVGAGGGALYGVAVSRNEEYLQQRDEYELGVGGDQARSDIVSMSNEGWGYKVAGWALMGVGIAALVTSVILFVAFDGRATPETTDSDSTDTSLVPTTDGGGIWVSECR